MKKSTAVILLEAGGLVASLLLAFLNLYWIGFAAGLFSEWVILFVSVLLTVSAAFAGCLLQNLFRSQYGTKAPAFWLIAFVPPVVFSGIAFAIARQLGSFASLAASLLALSWMLSSVIFAVAGVVCLGMMAATKKRNSENGTDENGKA